MSKLFAISVHRGGSARPVQPETLLSTMKSPPPCVSLILAFDSHLSISRRTDLDPPRHWGLDQPRGGFIDGEPISCGCPLKVLHFRKHSASSRRAATRCTPSVRHDAPGVARCGMGRRPGSARYPARLQGEVGSQPNHAHPLSPLARPRRAAPRNREASRCGRAGQHRTRLELRPSSSACRCTECVASRWTA